MIKMRYILFLFATLLLVATSCVHSTKNRVVMVTIQPQKYFAERIVGDKFEINCVIPRDSNPIIYEPSAALLLQISKSDAYMKVGHLDFELAWLDKLQQDNPKMKVYDTSEGVDLLFSDSLLLKNNQISNSAAREFIDPHIWSSPRQAIVMVENMYNVFVELDPDSEDICYRNYELLLQELKAADQYLTKKLAPIAGNKFVIYHSSLSYLAQDYNLVQRCIEREGAEPTAAYMQALMSADSINVLLVQDKFDTRQIEAIAPELGCRVVSINPLNYNYFEEIVKVANALVGE